jgi:hypothetical protein
MQDQAAAFTANAALPALNLAVPSRSPTSASSIMRSTLYLYHFGRDNVNLHLQLAGRARASKCAIILPTRRAKRGSDPAGHLFRAHTQRSNA